MRPPIHLLLIALAAPILFAGAAAGADDEWSQCGPGFQVPDRPAREAAESGADPETIHLSADEAEVVEEGVSRFTGNVTIEQGTRQLQSEEIVYSQSENVIEAKGGVRFWDDGLFVAGDSARAEIERNSVTFGPTAEFMLEKEHGHGEASEVSSSGIDRLNARDVSYTTCNPGEVDWRITASQVELDRVEDAGTARNVWLEFKGQRLMYLPWISFPLSSQRKSGFLTPAFGASGSTGAEVTVPYYFNLAPNYDATIAARTMSDRGVLAQGEFRFLSNTYGRGRIAAHHLPYDSKFDDERTAANLLHRHRWSNRWSTDTRLEWVSDTAYYEDLGTSLSQSSRTHLTRRFDARYRGNRWDARLRLQDFMTLDRTVGRPYARLPQVSIRTLLPERNRALNFDLTAELAYFDHESRTTGSRVDLQPSFTFPHRTGGAFVTPKAALHITKYNLNRTSGEATLDDSPSRALPSFSLDGGLFLERPVSVAGKSLVHTIEPRVYYLRVPYDDQNELPRFDTSLPSFSFAQLFRENRFSGGDRIGDANQLTLALTSRLIDDQGGELASASIGQIRHFRDRKVSLRGGVPETTNASDFVAEIEARPTREWRLRAGLQYDTDADRTEKSALTARFRPNRRSVINAAYRLVRDIDPSKTIEQADLSFAWPLGTSWRTLGRWNFALNNDSSRTLEAFAGVEYDSCCWGFRMVARRYRRSSVRIDGEDQYSNGLFLQLELKGLTGVGNNTEAFLTRSIPGYENEF
ncbi:MAG: LPS-assembly protein LptD [Gammaproteobacteria bacterium]|nr:LPS-assembly protein LptD [Gammaproteobacteria bacterium]